MFCAEIIFFDLCMTEQVIAKVRPEIPNGVITRVQHETAFMLMQIDSAVG